MLGGGVLLAPLVGKGAVEFVARRGGTLEEVLRETGRVALGLWPIGGTWYPYVAQVDGRVIPCRGVPPFKLTHNGLFVDGPFTLRPVRAGDRIVIAC